MKKASVSQLKTSLSAYLLGVKNGEEVLVTERGRPIARLVPARGAEGATDRTRRLIRSREPKARVALPAYQPFVTAISGMG